MRLTCFLMSKVELNQSESIYQVKGDKQSHPEGDRIVDVVTSADEYYA